MDINQFSSSRINRNVRQNFNRNINTHFDNIQILANIIQDSQRLLESNNNNNILNDMNNLILNPRTSVNSTNNRPSNYVLYFST